MFFTLTALSFYYLANMVNGLCPKSFQFNIPNTIGRNTSCTQLESLTCVAVRPASITWDTGDTSNITFCLNFAIDAVGIRLININGSIITGRFSVRPYSLTILYPLPSLECETSGLTTEIGLGDGYIGPNAIRCESTDEYSPGITNTPMPTNIARTIICNFLVRPKICPIN